MNREKKTELLVFCGLLAASFGLRLVRINNSFWYDEIHTLLAYVMLDWSKVPTNIITPNNHVLYTLLAKLSISLFGLKEWSLRLPALIMGGLTPPACYLIFRSRVKPLTALSAALFLLLSFWMVWFSQEARGYSAYILFAVLGQHLYLRWLEHGRRNDAFLCGLCSVAGCYFYFYTCFVICAQIACGFFYWLMKKEKRKASQFVLPVTALLISAALYLPAVAGMKKYLDEVAHNTAGQWLDQVLLLESLRMFAGTRWLAPAIIFAVVFLLGLIRLGKTWPAFCRMNILAGGFLILFTWLEHVFIYSRFLAFLLPFYFLSLASALELLGDKAHSYWPKLKPGLLQASLALVVCAFLLPGLARYYKLGKQEFKQAAIYASVNYWRRPVISFGLAAKQYLLYDPEAQEWPQSQPLNPEDVDGKLVVASHPWSWSKKNVEVLKQYCRLEKTWESAGYQENNVYLFRCF